MLSLSSGLVFIPLLLSAVGDVPFDDEFLHGNDYSLCVPWALEANLQTWEQVLPFYTDPPFVLPSQLDLILPSLGNEVVRPALQNTAHANPMPDEWAALSRTPRKVKQAT